MFRQVKGLKNQRDEHTYLPQTETSLFYIKVPFYFFIFIFLLTEI